VAQGHQRADEGRAAVGLALQTLQQQGVVGGVLHQPAGFAVSGSECLGRQRRKVRRSHTGRPAQRVDAQARVVGQRGQATGRGGMARLGQRRSR
jgi:hypothetical protein